MKEGVTEEGVTEKDDGAMGDEQGSVSRKADADGKDAGDVGEGSVWAGESVAVEGIDKRRRQQVERSKRAEAIGWSTICLHLRLTYPGSPLKSNAEILLN